METNWTADAGLVEQMFDASPVPMVITSIERNLVLAVNARTCEMFGMSKEQAVGQTVTAFYMQPADRAEVIAAMRSKGHLDDIRLSLRRPDGTPLWVVASGRQMTRNGEEAILWAFADITGQVTAEQALAASERRLAEQSRTLTALTERSADATESFDRRLCDILRVAAETLQAERVSLWRLDAGHAAIQCVSLFKKTSGQYESGARIERADCVPYFEALETERVIAAHDAHRDPSDDLLSRRLPRPERHRRDARRAAAAAARHARRPLHRARGRRPDVDARRAELRVVGRQSDCRRAGR